MVTACVAVIVAFGGVAWAAEEPSLGAYVRHPGARTAGAIRARLAAQGGDASPVELLVLADADRRSGRGREALARFVAVADGEAGLPWTAWAQLGAGGLLLRRGRVDEARERFAVVAALDGDTGAVGALWLGVLETRRDAFAAARGWFDDAGTRATSADVRRSAAMWSAYARLWDGDASGAGEAFERLADVAPADALTDDARYAAGVAWRRAGDVDRAGRAWTRAAAGTPGTRRPSEALSALQPSAVVRAAWRRGERQPPAPPERQALAALDGDGARLAQLALAAPGAERADAEATRPTTTQRPSDFVAAGCTPATPVPPAATEATSTIWAAGAAFLALAGLALVWHRRR